MRQIINTFRLDNYYHLQLIYLEEFCYGNDPLLKIFGVNNFDVNNFEHALFEIQHHCDDNYEVFYKKLNKISGDLDFDIKFYEEEILKIVQTNSPPQFDAIKWYVDGAFYAEEYLHINKKLSGKGSYAVNGKKVGYWESYFENGGLYCKGNYDNGEQVGYWEYYFDDGKLSGKGNYDNGNQVGYWEEYNNAGELTDASFYL